ncbi:MULTISPECIES: sugar transferase [Cyanophyceae]|uniref:Sugar transferase n=1 Tax=Leptolyngbya subtilissima DQ-A4 TaxID=2933933 RepID=A0ABV0K1E6_9CYAN|nr:sugar transferase [Nodosilinea sp. FACHB-141]MBD2112382.1 sugar transferase [Nodosilinea sp. FACHB-141]
MFQFFFAPKAYQATLNEILVIPDTVQLAPTHPSVNSALKRCLDVVGGLLGVLITLFLLVPIAVAIQLDNPGPVFFSQLRCGYQGQPFRIWKFRSMVANADELKHLVENQAQGLIFKNENDPRITRVGKFLRRTSLDEFPQFWNVLWGDMSLVGTRPPTLSEVQQYKPHHWQRLNVKPGLTGKWQAQGRSSIKDFEAIVKMDIDYQTQWSLGHDVQLIVQTLGAVMLSRGAY